MSNLQSYKIDKAIHPGRTLTETLDVLSISQKELAQKSELTVKHISNIANEKASITPETALKLEAMLHVSADFWNSLEKNYQATLARIAHKEHIKLESQKVVEYRETYRELVTRGLLPSLQFSKGNLSEITENLLKFFRAFSFDSVAQVSQAAFRRYDHARINYRTVEAVIRVGELKAERVDTKPFNAKGLAGALQDIKKLSNKEYTAYMPEIETILAEFGVVFVAIPGFAKTSLQGVSKWLSKDKVMIILKTDGQTEKTNQYEDIFFFNLFHEIAHILKHSKKKTFVDLQNKIDSEEEKEADTFASQVLMPSFEKADLDVYSDGETISAKRAVSGLSKKYGIAESVVAGQISHLFKDAQSTVYKVLSKYKVPINYSNHLS